MKVIVIILAISLCFTFVESVKPIKRIKAADSLLPPLHDNDNSTTVIDEDSKISEEIVEDSKIPEEIVEDKVEENQATENEAEKENKEESSTETAVDNDIEDNEVTETKETTLDREDKNYRGGTKFQSYGPNQFGFSEDKNYRSGAELHSYSPKQFGFSYSIGENHEHSRDEMISIEPKNDDDDDDEPQKVSARGSYSYILPDGFQYTVNYIADDHGFRPEVLVSKV